MAQEPDTNHRIWQVIALIPAGKVSTYGDVALHTGLGRGARQVARALRMLPEGSRIPWYRVINAQGKISIPEGTPSMLEQKERLKAEGIVFKNNKRVDLNIFRWKPGEL